MTLISGCTTSRRSHDAILNKESHPAVVFAAIALGAACGRAERSCEALTGARRWQDAATTCREEYRRTAGVAAGIAAARSLLWSGQPEQAEDVARGLATSERAADALLVLGEVAAQRGDAEPAGRAYDDALRRYDRVDDAAGASRAALGMSGTWLSRGDLARAMAASQLAIDRAHRAGDRQIQLYAHLGHAELLRRQGLTVAAEDELARAGDLASTPVDQAWLALKRGTLDVDLELDTLARTQLERVLALAAPGSIPGEVVLATHLNLAWIERRAGHLARALGHIDQAAAIRADATDVRLNRALILADQGRLDDAARELAAAERTASSVHSWWVAYNAGVIAGRRGDLDAMIAALRRSIDGVRAISSRAGAYAPDVAASHRLPYLRLFGAHARRAEWSAALGIVIELDALALLATDRAPARQPFDPPPNPPAAPPALPALESVVDAWRGRHLVIAISDEETLWRLELRDGQLRGEPVGRAGELETQARGLEADPGNTAAAGALGAAIVPPTSGHPGHPGDAAGGGIDVLLIGPIARTPLAALTHDSRPIITRTPLTRVLGVLPRKPPRPRSGGSVVLGDPRGDLPSARAEAIAVAATLGIAPTLGSAATSSALAAASNTGLLHVAAHASIDALGDATGGPRLLLDRAVTRADILASEGAPAIVVLASCGGAVARDEDGRGSLAAAYLAAGADAVIAASWSVDDEATRRFVEELYRHRVREQPARALAAAQLASRAAVPARIWAAFTVIAAPPQTSL